MKQARQLRHLGKLSRTARVAITLAGLLFATAAFAQEPGTEAPRTRAEAIEDERADKVAELWPERQSPMVNRVNGLVERGFKEGLDSGRGVNGPQIVLGGMRPGQGFTAGLGYRQSDSLARASRVPDHRPGHVPGRLPVRCRSQLSAPQDGTHVASVVHEIRKLT